MNEFLNPKAMLTPGAAGALMMLITNTLCAIFPELAFRFVALGLSFLIGAFAIAAANLPIVPRGGFWLLNSLVIFSVGVGTTNIAANVEKRAKQEVAATEWLLESAASLLVPSARAQAPAPITHSTELKKIHAPGTTSGSAGDEKVAAELERFRLENQKLRQQLEFAKKANLQAKERGAIERAEAVSRGGFFKKW